MTGSAFATTLTVPTAGFEITGGEAVRGGLKGEQIRHHHCPECFSWVFTRIEPDMGFVNVRTSTLDDPAPFPPLVEMFTSEKLAWAEVGAPHGFLAFPEQSDFPRLIAAYAEWRPDQGVQG